MDNFLKYVRVTCFIALFGMTFVTMYMRFNDNHRVTVNEQNIQELFHEVDKIKYAIETRPDTIVNKVEVYYK